MLHSPTLEVLNLMNNNLSGPIATPAWVLQPPEVPHDTDAQAMTKVDDPGFWLSGVWHVRAA